MRELGTWDQFLTKQNKHVTNTKHYAYFFDDLLTAWQHGFDLVNKPYIWPTLIDRSDYTNDPSIILAENEHWNLVWTPQILALFTKHLIPHDPSPLPFTTYTSPMLVRTLPLVDHRWINKKNAIKYDMIEIPPFTTLYDYHDPDIQIFRPCISKYQTASGDKQINCLHCDNYSTMWKFQFELPGGEWKLENACIWCTIKYIKSLCVNTYLSNISHRMNSHPELKLVLPFMTKLFLYTEMKNKFMGDSFEDNRRVVEMQGDGVRFHFGSIFEHSKTMTGITLSKHNDKRLDSVSFPFGVYTSFDVPHRDLADLTFTLTPRKHVSSEIYIPPFTQICNNSKITLEQKHGEFIWGIHSSYSEDSFKRKDFFFASVFEFFYEWGLYNGMDHQTLLGDRYWLVKIPVNKMAYNMQGCIGTPFNCVRGMDVLQSIEVDQAYLKKLTKSVFPEYVHWVQHETRTLHPWKYYNPPTTNQKYITDIEMNEFLKHNPPPKKFYLQLTPHELIKQHSLIGRTEHFLSQRLIKSKVCSQKMINIFGKLLSSGWSDIFEPIDDTFYRILINKKTKKSIKFNKKTKKIFFENTVVNEKNIFDQINSPIKTDLKHDPKCLDKIRKMMKPTQITELNFFLKQSEFELSVFETSWCHHLSARNYTDDQVFNIGFIRDYKVIWHKHAIEIWSKQCIDYCNTPLPFETNTARKWLRSIPDHDHRWLATSFCDDQNRVKIPKDQPVDLTLVRNKHFELWSGLIKSKNSSNILKRFMLNCGHKYSVSWCEIEGKTCCYNCVDSKIPSYLPSQNKNSAEHVDPENFFLISPYIKDTCSLTDNFDNKTATLDINAESESFFFPHFDFIIWLSIHSNLRTSTET
jgi:hypothetical protein